MAHLTKFLCYVAAHTHCGRVGIAVLWMHGFQVLQLMHHEVKFLIGYNGAVEHIVSVVVLMKLLA